MQSSSNAIKVKNFTFAGNNMHGKGFDTRSSYTEIE